MEERKDYIYKSFFAKLEAQSTSTESISRAEDVPTLFWHTNSIIDNN
jgi:hypothetical protein